MANAAATVELPAPPQVDIKETIAPPSPVSNLIVSGEISEKIPNISLYIISTFWNRHIVGFSLNDSIPAESTKYENPHLFGNLL